MRERMMRRTEARLLVRLGALLLCALWIAPAVAQAADGAQPAQEATRETAADEVPKDQRSIDAQIAALGDASKEASKRGLQMMVGSRKLQALRPKLSSGDSPEKREGTRKKLEKWVGRLDNLRGRMEKQRDHIDELKARIRSLRREEISDEQADRLVKIEPGIENVWRALDRSIRELDVARRKGTNQLGKS